MNYKGGSDEPKKYAKIEVIVHKIFFVDGNKPESNEITEDWGKPEGQEYWEDEEDLPF